MPGLVSHSLRVIRADREMMLPMSQVRNDVILCVEDDQIPLTLRKCALQKAGYEVILATSGKEALRLAETHKFDLLLTDYLMPEMNGVELIKKMREHHTTIPCFLYSGLSDLSADELSIADKFFSKLEGIETVMAEIKKTLERLDGKES
jgi:CheY-like chemotaxis protein